MVAHAAQRTSSTELLRPKLDDTETLLGAVIRERNVRSRTDVLREKDVPTTVHVLLDGRACRYRVLHDGRRQITTLLMPGDVCGFEAVMRGQANYSVGALTDCILGEIPAERVADPTILGPDMARALWRRLLRDEAIAREWMANLGRRDGLERVAHLICELRVRLEAVGLASEDEFRLHLTQAELADVLGLSPVHVDRIVQQLRRTGLIQLSNGTLTVLDVPALQSLAGFDPAYLRLA